MKKLKVLVKYITRLDLLLNNRKYEVLLFSFLLLIFGDTFSNNRVTSVICIYLNFITGLLVFFNNKKVRWLILSVILITVVLDVFTPYFIFLDLRSVHGIIYVIFFVIVSREVFIEVLYIKNITRELLAAALCGFVLLCLIATFIFFLIDIQFPNSFSNVGNGKQMLTNLNYFSFTTLLTIGFGDITPVTVIAKRAVMLVGLIGHFYTVFITSIIIGKYLSLKNK